MAVLESIAAVKYCPTRYTIFQPYTNKPIGIGIFDTLGKSWRDQWVLRLDTPHGGHNYHHLNLNKKLTGVQDPHVEIPGGVVEAGGAATTAVKVVGYAALALAVCGDAYRLGCSMKEDYETNDTLIGKKTVKTGVTTAAGWGGGLLGAAGGSSCGAYVGGAIGALFGGIGAAPGAAIGGIVGTLIGGVGGGVGGSLGAEVVTDAKLTGVQDPHVEIPGGVVEAGGAATTAVKVVGYAALALAVCGDAYRLGCSMKEDYETNDTLIGKKTVKTGVTTAAGWGGGLLGAAGGSSCGAYVGGAIGALFGGIGAAPGAAIGGIVGTLIGGVGGGVGGSLGAEVVTDAVYNNIRINKKGFIFKVDENHHICVIHNATPKTEKEDECQYLQRVTKDWLNLLTDIVMLAYSHDAGNSTKILSVLTRLHVDETLASISSDLVPLRYHEAYDQVFYESKFKDIKRSVVHKICSSLAFCTSKVSFYIRNADLNCKEKEVLLRKKNTDFCSFLKNPVQLIDPYKFPDIIIEKKDNHILHFEDRESLVLPKELRKIQVKRDVKFVLPKIQNEALVMDVTGKALFWLNPKIGARAAAILIEKSFSDLEIISD
ncbi:hypothetical protein B566_EDAN010715 [Ephemera danica]|nr:hypothetical protein B566_EDAN010715 [Ephemera danica]